MYFVGSWPEGERRRIILKEHQPTIQHIGVVRDFIRMEPRIKIGSREFDIWPWVFNITKRASWFSVSLS